MEKFSDRHGLYPEDEEIKIRLEAPPELRSVLVDIAYECGINPHKLRELVCKILRVRKNEDNWSAFPNVDSEVRSNIDGCEWYEVYDIIEGISELIKDTVGDNEEDNYGREINKYFHKRGIGWQLIHGKIETRGNESFEIYISNSKSILQNSSQNIASDEIHEAIMDLSRRPKPDVTGAIQHSIAALECVARSATKDPRATLGAILSKNHNLLPPPLNQGIEKLWGYASEQGRHINEGKIPSYEEAELSVGISASICIYLAKKMGK